MTKTIKQKGVFSVLTLKPKQKIFWKFLFSEIGEFYKIKKISTRTYNGLMSAKYTSPFQIVFELDSLIKIHQFGRESLQEVKDLFLEYGIDTDDEVEICFIQGYILKELNKSIRECTGLYLPLKSLFEKRLSRLDTDYGPSELFNDNKLFDILRSIIEYGIYPKQGRFSKPAISTHEYIYHVKYEIIKYLKKKYK